MGRGLRKRRRKRPLRRCGRVARVGVVAVHGVHIPVGQHRHDRLVRPGDHATPERIGVAVEVHACVEPPVAGVGRLADADGRRRGDHAVVACVGVREERIEFESARTSTAEAGHDHALRHVGGDGVVALRREDAIVDVGRAVGRPLRGVVLHHRAVVGARVAPDRATRRRGAANADRIVDELAVRSDGVNRGTIGRHRPVGHDKAPHEPSAMGDGGAPRHVVRDDAVPQHEPGRPAARRRRTQRAAAQTVTVGCQTFASRRMAPRQREALHVSVRFRRHASYGV